MYPAIFSIIVGCWMALSIGGASAAANDPAAPSAPFIKEVNMQMHLSGTWTPGLSAAEQQTLFAIARDSLAWCVGEERKPFSFEPYSLTPKLKAPLASFVTLKINGNLRGCIGSLEPIEALYLSIHHNAVSAATRDHRFQPVRSTELARLELDLSILSPIRPIATPAEFKLGQQGIILEKGRRRAVFLPEVAIEQGWNKEQTLAYLSQKAGLAADAWRQDAALWVFESMVISLDKGQQ